MEGLWGRIREIVSLDEWWVESLKESREIYSIFLNNLNLNKYQKRIVDWKKNFKKKKQKRLRQRSNN